MQDLLNKYFSGILSEEEKQTLFQEVKINQELKNEFVEQRNLISLVKTYHETANPEYIREKFNTLKKKQRKKSFYKFSGFIIRYAAVIMLLLTCGYLYTHHSRQQIQALQKLIIEVPTGQRTQVSLPDGSKIWLNAETILTYPSDFTTNKREIFLRGEGYFEIASDAKNPFIIHTDLMDVTVLGTKFNVKSYPEEKATISLKEGKIEITTSDEKNKLILQPYEEVCVSTDMQVTLSGKIGMEYAESWKNGEFGYLNASLESIVNDLGRRFNRTIIISSAEIRNERFTYRAAENTTLEEIFRHLQKTKEFTYKKHADHIEIYKY